VGISLTLSLAVDVASPPVAEATAEELVFVPEVEGLPDEAITVGGAWPSIGSSMTIISV